MLSSKTGTYASIGLPASQDETGTYLPDAVITPLVQEAQKMAPQVFEAPAAATGGMTAIKSPQISPEKSRTLILEALERFDPALADKAREIFNTGFDSAIHKNFIEDLSAPNLTEDSSRWRIRQVAAGQTRIMRSLEAKSEKNEFDPSNPNAKSVIQFEYDSTINSTIYLAHELGHSMADDFIRDKDGNKFGNNPKHLDEFQAYFIQNIVAEDLKRNPDPAIAQAAKTHHQATLATNLSQIPQGLSAIEAQKESKSRYIKEESNQKNEDAIGRFHLRPVSLLLASGLVVQMQNKPLEERHKLAETLLGKDGPKNIVDVFAVAGIQADVDIRSLSQAALQKAVQPAIKTPAVSLQRPVAKTSLQVNA